MTEQEAEAFAERLTRIWIGRETSRLKIEPSETWPEVLPSCGGIVWTAGAERNWKWFAFQTLLVTHVTLSAKIRPGHSEIEFYLEGGGGNLCSFRQDMSPPLGCFTANSDFTAHWLPFFRRGCWLSGCAIEASAHERAEWIQGFSKEEVEAWNLKF